jgi:hypothetical protein
MNNFQEKLESLADINYLQIQHGEAEENISNLLDGYCNDENKKIYMLWLEYEYLKNMGYENMYKVVMSKYSSKRECKIDFNGKEISYKYKMHILGRYFSNRVLSDDTNPRRGLRDLIWKNKHIEKIEQFSEWDQKLVNPFKTTLNQVLESLRNTEKMNNIVLCSVPNSGINRFSDFIRGSNFKDTKEVFLIPDLLISKENTTPTTHYRKQVTRKTLEDNFMFNKKYSELIKKNNLKLIMIDDVRTTGQHLEYCIELILNERYEHNLDNEFLLRYHSAETSILQNALVNSYLHKGIYTSRHIVETDSLMEVECLVLANTQDFYQGFENSTGRYIPVFEGGI